MALSVAVEFWKGGMGNAIVIAIVTKGDGEKYFLFFQFSS